jgi:hypothetical protein
MGEQRWMTEKKMQETTRQMEWGALSQDRVVLDAFDIATTHGRLDILKEVVSVLAHFQGRL